MPEESIAAYINNIIAFILFIFIIILIFTALFLLSRTLIYRTRKEYGIELKKEFITASDSYLFNYKKDPYRMKNFFILALVFNFIISLILLIILVFNYVREPAQRSNIYLILSILLYYILMVVYVIKSKAID